MGQILLPKHLHPDFSRPGVKPVGPITLDYDSPVSRGLYDAWMQVGRDRLRSAGGKADFIEAFASVQNTPQYLEFDGNNHKPEASVHQSPAFAWTFDFLSRVGTSTDSLISDGGGGSGTFNLRLEGANKQISQFRSGAIRTRSVTNAYVDDVRNIVTVTGDGSATSGSIQIYLNGVELALANNAADAMSERTTTMRLAERVDGTEDLNGRIYCVIHHHAHLTSAEVIRLHKDLKQVVKPAVPQLYFTPAAGGDTNVSATTDALTLTEAAATITFDVGVAATTDALVLTEQAATIALGVTISATTDALVLTESAATITFDVGVSSTTDALVLTEFAATIASDVGISATTDALTIAEFAATVDTAAATARASYPLLREFHPDFAVPNRKPVGPVQIDQSNAFAQDLVMLILGQDRYDATIGQGRPMLVPGIKSPANTGTVRAVGKNGPAIAFDGTLDKLEWASALDSVPFIVQSFAVWLELYYPVSVAANGYLWSASNESLISTDTGTFFYEYDDGTPRTLDSGIDPVVGETYRILVTKKQGVGTQMWVDGVLAASDTFTGDIAYGGNKATSIGRSPSGSGSRFNVVTAGFIGRGLSEAECKSLSSDMYQMLKPANALAYALEPAGGTEVLAGVDALTLTEFSATIVAATSISATTDALVLTEFAAAIALDVSVAATTDALVLSESAATIDYSVSVAATTDALSLTEFAASVSYDTNVLATTDALTLTEAAATIDLSTTVAATTDALTLAEFASTISLDVSVAAGTDALVVATYAAGVISSGSFIVSESNWTLSQRRTRWALSKRGTEFLPIARDVNWRAK